MIAWSSYDAAAKTYALRVLRAGVARRHRAVARSPRAVRPRRRPRARTARRSSSTRAAATSSSSTPRPAPRAAAGRGQHGRAPRCTRASAATHSPSCARRARRKARPTLYLRKSGDTRKQPRPKFKETLAIEDVELSDRGLFVVYRTDIVPTCCTRAVLYRVDGKKLRWLFAVGSGGANFGQLVTPSVVGRSVFFARTNDGSGQGNNLFRFDLRTKKLFSARGIQPRGVPDLARRPLPDEPQLPRLHRPAGHGPDRDADLRARDHRPAGVQARVEGRPAQDPLLTLNGV